MVIEAEQGLGEIGDGAALKRQCLGCEEGWIEIGQIGCRDGKERRAHEASLKNQKKVKEVEPNWRQIEDRLKRRWREWITGWTNSSKAGEESK
ncbi:hypothetical protein M0R45_009242 [Rubus argutus]|uniref:Uncharacterized protein n=1 Tax=Rubus argutus TaxID=59490 RepID=A0AAW1Y3W3_RUBAR